MSHLKQNPLEASNTLLTRIDVALIPSEPLFSSIIDASQAITKQFTNWNIIDRDVFPPHASLHICTILTASLQSFIKRLRQDCKSMPMIESIEIVKGSSGYISLKLKVSPAIRALHENIIAISADVRGPNFDENPERLNQLSGYDKLNFQKYGSLFVLDKFDAHISIAKVAPEHQDAAMKIAESLLPVVSEANIPTAMQICDIGMRSEKWIVLGDVKL